MFSGTNFSIGGGFNGGLFAFFYPHCDFDTATCSYDFTQSYPAVGGPTFGSDFTYNGITYPASDYIQFTFNVLSSAVSAPATSCRVFNIFDRYCSAPAFGPVPFTMTGSFLIKDVNGNAVLASDTISGAGVVSTTATDFLLEGNIFFQFTSTPEPTSLGLVGAGLLLTGWLARRQPAKA